MGSCSMDQRPRNHAVNIALLSAETANWEVFLRSHLNIMNDRFERASDGSYAQATRNTYIRELEELEINVPDLMLGISIWVENPGKHHYFGNISRVGRALSETRHATEIEKSILEMVSDNNLDTYNRVLMYYLFLNYNQYLTDKNQQQKNAERLTEAVKTLPAYMATRIEAKKEMQRK